MIKNKVNGNFNIEIDTTEINDAVQKAISHTLSGLNIKERIEGRINQAVKKNTDKIFQSGTFYNSLAKNIAPLIDVSRVIEEIDMDELKNLIAEKVSTKLIEKMNTK